MSYVIRHCRTPISHNVAFEETVSDTDLKSILAIHRNKLVFTTQAARNRGNPHVLKVWQETGTDGRVILMEDRQFNGHWISNTLKGLLNAKAPDVYAD